MVAMMVFSMVIAAIYSTWALVLRASQVGQDAAAQAQRQRVVLRAIGDALMGVESFQASQKYYWFRLANGGEPYLSFVARLPDTYARNGKFVGAAGGRDASSRRVTFSLAAGENGEKDLILRQNPILMDMDQDEEKYPLVLARNVKTFTIEWWGTNNLNEPGWSMDWDDSMTNTIPAMLRVHLVMGANVANGNSAGVRRDAHLHRAVADDAGHRAARRPGRAGRRARFAPASADCARRKPQSPARSQSIQPWKETAMKIVFTRKKRGFAVLIALVAVTVLTLLAGAFAYAMKIETRLAANTNDDEQFYWIGRGGVERACWWLALEGNQPFSSVLESRPRRRAGNQRHPRGRIAGQFSNRRRHRFADVDRAGKQAQHQHR